MFKDRPSVETFEKPDGNKTVCKKENKKSG